MQLALFPPVEAVLDVADLAALLLEWDADPNDARLLARVRAQCGPTDLLRQARDHLAEHRRAWRQHDSA